MLGENGELVMDRAFAGTIPAVENFASTKQTRADLRPDEVAKTYRFSSAADQADREQRRDDKRRQRRQDGAQPAPGAGSDNLPEREQ